MLKDSQSKADIKVGVPGIAMEYSIYSVLTAISADTC